MIIIIICFVTSLFLVTRSNCDTKIWTYDEDITNPKNWMHESVRKDCNGLIFQDDDPLGNRFIDKLRIKQIVLPKRGSILFNEGSEIIFDEHGENKLNCVELKPSSYHEWNDVTMWYNQDQPGNSAIPHAERIPCILDDVVFPKGLHSGYVFLNRLKVKSFKFGERYIGHNEFERFLETEEGKEIFLGTFFFNIKIKNQICQDLTGCQCGTYNDYRCKYLTNKETDQFKCDNPVTPLGFCGNAPICGGSILIHKFSPEFEIEKVKNKLKEYESDTYASKIDDKIQIVFSEKDFTGKSLEEMDSFFELLLNDQSYNPKEIRVLKSGLPLTEREVRHAFEMIFGTLLGVVLMFALMFFIFSPTAVRLNLRNRLLRTRPLSTYMFARYDNIEDRGYILESESTAGSVLSLDRAFENLMYGETPSTSTSVDTIAPKQEPGEPFSFFPFSAPSSTLSVVGA